MPGYPVDYIEWYWSGTDFDRFNAWRFSLESGLGETHIKDVGFYAWAVRDGDVNPFCKGNFDFDNDVDGSDAHTFKQHFGRSAFKNPCPPDGPAPVERTWQTNCYDVDGLPINCPGTGQDGEYQKGVIWPNARFTDNGNGTVTDNLTGLIWLKNANCFGIRTWEEALSDCNGLSAGWCGLTDGSSIGNWRLPQIKELQSIIDYSKYNPALPLGHPFTNMQIYSHWSSTTSVNDVDYAWTVYLYNGNVGLKDKSIAFDGYVWPVRGGH
jgi:hypothetical protein